MLAALNYLGRQQQTKQKKNKRAFRMLFQLVLAAGLLLLMLLPNHSVSADITSVSPINPNLGQKVTVRGDGFGEFDPANAVISLTGPSGDTLEVAPAYPGAENWTNESVTFQIPAGIDFGQYQIQIAGQSAPTAINVVNHFTPANVNGTPYYTEDYIISNTQAVNVSEAVRSVAQSFLLPIKESIDEIGSYTESVLTFKLAVDSGDGNDGAVIEEVWFFTRSVANSLFLVLLVLAGFYIMFRIDRYQYQYSIRQVIPRFMAAVLLVNISYIISRILIDITLVLTFVILDSVSLPPGQQIAEILLGDLNLNLFVVFMVGLYLFILTLYSIVLIFLILRVVAIWLLTITSPFVFMTLIFPLGDNIVRSWFKRMAQLLIIGPVAAFLLFVGYNISQTAQEFENASLMQAFIGSSTLVTMLVIPFLMSSASSFVQKNIIPSPAVAPTTSNTVTATAQTGSGGNAPPPTVGGTSSTSSEAGGRTQYQKVDLNEVDKDKLKTMAVPLTQEMQDKFKFILQGRQERERDAANSIFRSHVGSNAVTGQPKNLSVEQRKAAAIKQILEKQVDAQNNGENTGNVTTGDNQLNSASPQLIISWLEDEQGNKQIVRAGITQSQGQVPQEQAQAVFNQQSGRVLLGEMASSGTNEEQLASSVLIGNVLQQDPNSLKLVAQDSENGGTEIRSAARSIIQAGVQQLGQRLSENPNDPALARVAEQLLVGAPQLLSSALGEMDQSTTLLIQTGAEQAAQHMGEQLEQAQQQAPLSVTLKSNTEEGQQLQQLANTAGQTIIAPQVDIGKLAEQPHGEAFVTGALFAETPDPLIVREKFVEAAAAAPQNQAFTHISRDVYSNVQTSEVKNLPTSITSSVAQYLGSEEFAQQPDTNLLAKYLQGNTPATLMAAGPLSAEVLAKADLGQMVNSAPVEQQAHVQASLPAQLMLAGSVPDLRDTQPELIGRVENELPNLIREQPEIGGAAALKLMAESDLSSLQPATLELAQHVLAQENVNELAPPKVLAQASEKLLSNSSPEQLNQLAQNSQLAQNLVNQGLPAVAKNQEQASRVLPQLMENQGLVSQLSAAAARDTLAHVSPEEMEQLISNPVAQTFLAQRASQDLQENEVIDGQAAVNMALMTPAEEMKTLPWNAIKAVMKEMLKYDRQTPIFTKLEEKLGNASPEAREQAQQSLSLEQPQLTSTDQAALQQAAQEGAAATQATLQAEQAVAAQTSNKTTTNVSVGTPTVEQATAPTVSTNVSTPGPKVNNDPTSLDSYTLKALSNMSSAQLAQTDDKVRWQAHDQLASKTQTTDEDHQLAAKIVVSVTAEDLGNISDKVMNMAAKTSSSDLSNASRDQIQEDLKREQAIMNISAPRDEE